MSTKPVHVKVFDPESGEELEKYTLENDFLLICRGSSYLSGEQHYTTTRTTVLTIKRRDHLDVPVVPGKPGGGS